jgi:simple sugar transport system substrate-binding protein
MIPILIRGEKIGESMKKSGVLAIVAAAALAVTASGCSSGSDSADRRYVVSVKLIGVGWFDNMEKGITEWAGDNGIDASMTGATDASPEKQSKMVEDLIAQKVTGIGIVPNDVASIDGVIAKAKDAGIYVVTHEAGGTKNADANIEAFNNAAYGAEIMDNLAACMGSTGKYVAFVGTLTNGSHNEWVAGAKAQLDANYPNIQRVENPIESKEDADVAYNKTKELLKKYPDLKGFQGSSANDVVGIGRAVEELGLTDKTCVMGTSIPSMTEKLLATGAIDKIFLWDSALAGKAMLAMLEILVNGGTIEAGLDLGVPGYESITVSSSNPKSFEGAAWLVLDKDTASQYKI